MLVDLDTYGLDSAWEIGFAEAKSIPVVGFSYDEEVITNPRIVNIRRFDENFMHGWDTNPVVDNLDALQNLCREKSVYVCGAFKNESAMETLRNSDLQKATKKLVFPKDVIELGKSFPKDYPWRSREQAIKLLAQADVALVILPRYGMDTAWQIGYATGLDKVIIGWTGPDPGREIAEAPIWDHWMHGWKEKLTVTKIEELTAIIVGFHQTGLFSERLTR